MIKDQKSIRNELLDVEKRSSDASLKVIELQKQMTAIEIERKRELASSDPFKTVRYNPGSVKKN